MRAEGEGAACFGAALLGMEPGRDTTTTTTTTTATDTLLPPLRIILPLLPLSLPLLPPLYYYYHYYDYNYWGWGCLGEDGARQRHHYRSWQCVQWEQSGTPTEGRRMLNLCCYLWTETGTFGSPTPAPAGCTKDGR